MPLEPYRKKRNFAVTPEPTPEATEGPAVPGSLSFVVQKHAARRLHYDVRLELDGALLSWAVPKGPSLVPSDKRLAVRTEDHPLAYGSFEGNIPPGEYGGGTVLLWDRGTWIPKGDPHRALLDGHLTFELFGERLRGGWHLVHTGGEQWLLMKQRDRHANLSWNIDSFTTSIESGKTMEQVAALDLPWPMTPQLATARDSPPTGHGWVHEIKLDGYRVLARVHRTQATLCTRSGLDWSAKVPSLTGALAAVGRNLILDGELVALDTEGRSVFGLLQERLGHNDDLFLYAFDLLSLDGQDLRSEPLLVRKQRLAEVLPSSSRVRYHQHIDHHGPTVLAHLCKLGAEGVVSKRADAPYRSGRNTDWIKVKCRGREDFVIGGFLERTPGTLASVLLGEPVGQGLRYVGRAGSGFSEVQRAAVRRALVAHAIPEPPFLDPPALARGDRPTWVRPNLHAEVAFAERTRTGQLRHPVFLGLRADRAEPPPKVSHPEKVLYPEDGITKQELAEWVFALRNRLLPELADRPLTLLRCPNGHDRPPRFYMKHPENVPDSIAPVEVPGDDQPGLAIRDSAGLLGLVQVAALEVHPWGSKVDAPDRPDRMVLDLDPDETLPFYRVVEAASEVRQRLADLGITSFVRTTGGKGLHVVAPFERGPTWDVLKGFTRSIAEQMVRDSPDRYVAVATKARRTGKIFVDYLRNGMGATAIGTWWFRAKPHAPVATPVPWDLLHNVDPSTFTVRTVTDSRDNPWEGIDRLRQPLYRRGEPASR